MHEYLLLHGGPYLFSALQPLWDLQVVELFARVAKHYLPYMLSCNEPLGQNSSRWCAQCEKCAFVYALLAAFLDPPEVWAVFGEDMLQVSGPPMQRFEELLGARAITRLPDGRTLPGKEALERLSASGQKSPETRMLSYLDGHTALKPLDCVGTKEEAQLALFLAERRRVAWAKREGHEPKLPRFFRGGVWAKARGEVRTNIRRVAALLDDFNGEHLLPAWLEPLMSELHAQRVVQAEELCREVDA